MAKKTPPKPPTVSRKPAIVPPKAASVSPEKTPRSKPPAGLALNPCSKCGAAVEALGEPTRQPHDGTVIIRQRVRCTEPGCSQINMQRDVLPAD